jgi:hypothetical protein
MNFDVTYCHLVGDVNFTNLFFDFKKDLHSFFKYFII